MATNDHLTVVGVFDDRTTAERAIQELHEAGFAPDDIGFAMRETDPPEGARDAGVGSKAGEGAMSGIVAGGVVGGVAAAAVSLLVPGVGPIIGGGLLATVLGGAAAGAATGGIAGAFIGMGVPEEEARYYNNEFEAGRALVTVRADSRYRDAADIIEKYAAPSREEMDRVRDVAAQPLSNAIEESAVNAGATAAGTIPEENRPVPFQQMPAGDDQRPVAEVRPGLLRPPTGSDASPVPHPPIAAAHPEPEEHMMATPDPASHQAAHPEQATNDAPLMTGPGQSGRWPTRADDSEAGKFVVGEEAAQRLDTTVHGSGETMRSRDAANAEGPYISPDEDLERVGATSGMNTQKQTGR